MMAHTGSTRRLRITYQGIVQGVGFRPYIYRSAVSCGLAGYVQNRRSEVVAELEGPTGKIEEFRALVDKDLPGPARIDNVRVDELSPIGDEAFLIRASESSVYTVPPIPPDLALCRHCRQELLDPGNRRYLYPFITCTECGPRYSIVEDTPFDRDRTSMAYFIQCPDCQSEFENPMDRRFHSQTNSCASCGPSLLLQTADGEQLDGDPLVRTIEELGRGRVVAIKGIGGFHLAADPRFSDAVARLRRAKERERKPFALMARDLEEITGPCEVSAEEANLLASAVSPIVILETRSRWPAHLKQVSDLGTLGFMLPYTPLHYLLFFHPEVEIPYRHLIMTSGNRGNEPIISELDEARRTLDGVAELFLSHNRRILFPSDDSIVRVGRSATAGEALHQEGPIIIRRSRGYVPGTIPLARRICEPTLAAGSDLKSAPAVAIDDAVLLAPHVGDLAEPAGREAYEAAIGRLLSLISVTPTRVVYDLHPKYYSSASAKERPMPARIPLQHHYAHALSVMAEQGLEESLCVAFDGTGYGTDGTIWGGEFLAVTRSGFRRLGSLRPFLLPGGEAAIRRPVRILFSLLHGAPGLNRGFALDGLTSDERALLEQMIERQVNAPVTSSAGRLFDAAAALLGLVREVSYEGEGPMKLETLAWSAVNAASTAAFPSPSTVPSADLGQLIPLVVPDASDTDFQIDPRPLLLHLLRARASQSDARLALLFHEAVAAAILEGALRMRELTGQRLLCLSGGVFQNLLLRTLLEAPLAAAGFEVFWNRTVPPGDGGLALGQAWYAGHESDGPG